MPMMLMPGANLQPPTQYGWVRQQQQHLVQQPKPPSDPNPPGTFAPCPPPPPPPDTPSSAKPLFPGVLNDGRPPPPP